MKVRLPKHREFLIKFEDGYDKADEAWEELNKIVKDYSVDANRFIPKALLRTTKQRLKRFRKNTNLNTKS